MSLNKVLIIGNLGADPEAIALPNGKAARISVASSRKWTDKQTNQLVEVTEWHRIVLFNRLADVAQNYLKKGAQVYVEGYLQTKKYADKQGIERWSTDIIANSLQMLGKKDTSDNSYISELAKQQAQAPAHVYENFEDIPF